MVVSKREIKKIIVHCSASSWGDFKAVDSWHKERGWKGCGYHFLILNGLRILGTKFESDVDGLVESGRDVNIQGAHTFGENSDSIGICCIGNQHFTSKQLFSALPRLLTSLCNTHKISTNNIYGHNNFTSGKTCPNIDIEVVREMVFQRIKEIKPNLRS